MNPKSEKEIWDDELWEKVYVNEFRKVKELKTDPQYDEALNDDLDALAAVLKERNKIEAHYYVKYCPRNILWEDLTSEMQDIIYYLAYTLKEELRYEGKYLPTKIKEIKDQKVLNLMEEIYRAEEKAAQLRTKLPNPEFETIEDCIREMKIKTNQGAFKTYAASYRWAMENCRITNSPKYCPNGTIETFEQCERAAERLSGKGDYIQLTSRMRKSLQ